MELTVDGFRKTVFVDGNPRRVVGLTERYYIRHGGGHRWELRIVVRARCLIIRKHVEFMGTKLPVRSSANFTEYSFDVREHVHYTSIYCDEPRGPLFRGFGTIYLQGPFAPPEVYTI